MSAEVSRLKSKLGYQNQETRVEHSSQGGNDQMNKQIAKLTAENRKLKEQIRLFLKDDLNNSVVA